MNWYITVLKKYATFEGRASRSEFWYFNLIHILIISIGSGLIIFLVNQNIDDTLIGIIYFILIGYSLVTFLPQLGVLVRRLHDTGRSGWWYFVVLIPLIGVVILLILLCLDSKEEKNKYGKNPKIRLIEEEVKDTFNLDIEENTPDSTEIITLKNKNCSLYSLVPEDKNLPIINIPHIVTDIITGEVRGKSLVIGRKETSDIFIENNYLSSRHLEVWLDVGMDGPELTRPDRVFIKDLGSTNGTYLDGEKLIAMEKQNLSPLDLEKRIILGSEEVVYRIKEP